MSQESNYSFSNLFFAAFDRYQTSQEMGMFLKLSQEDKNREIVSWAQKAGWQTQERIELIKVYI